MEKGTSVKELNVLLVGSNSSRKYLVGNIILGKQAFKSDVTACCEKGEGEVCGRRVKLVKAPGWLRGYDLCNTPELVKTEAILSVTPGLHSFILVINAEISFKDEYEKTTKKHLQHFFGDKVWDHTIVVFSHRSQIDQETIEDYIKREGAPLQSLLEACGNRYHVLCNDGTEHSEKVKELFEKIDDMVAKNSCYKTDSTLIASAELKKKEVDKKAEELRLQSQQQREKLRDLMTEPTLNLRILMVGWVFSGKSASGNTILKANMFQAGNRTKKALKQSGEVAGREVVIVDTPGWWKFFPAMFTSSPLKAEILNGVSLCSPSPNVILLGVPVDTSFTDDQRRVTEDNMRLLGQRVWRHVIVLFTFGEALGDKTIEQHIESEGKPLRWLIDKCGSRYHVLRSTDDDDQVRELLEKMEEMVAGNSSFYLSANPDADCTKHLEDIIDNLTEIKDENTTKKITEQLTIQWDRKNWEKHHCEGSIDLPPCISEAKQSSEGSEGEEEQMENWLKSFIGPKVATEEDAGSGPLNILSELMEREWLRREVCIEFSNPTADCYQQLRAGEKVRLWLKTQHSSGYGTASNLSDPLKDNNLCLGQACSPPGRNRAYSDLN